MSTINFYLDRPNNKLEFPIRLTYQMSGQKFRYYTKLKTLESDWDSKNQRIKKSCPLANETNAILDNLENSLKQIERQAIFDRINLSVASVKAKFEELVQKKQKAHGFHLLLTQYLEESKTTKAIGTVKGLQSRFNKLLSFEKEKKYPLSFESMDKSFYDLYVKYLINDCNFLNNTVGGCIKSLKSFLNYANELGINKNMTYKKFKVFKEDIDLIYMNEDEVMHLYNLEIPNESLQNVRDIFCFECCTGLRFSDVSKIEQINIEDELLKVRTIKTKDAISVPLNKFALAIIERNKIKYGTPLPSPISLQKMNDYLKDLGEFAKFNDEVIITKYSGAKRIEIRKPKFALMSTHAARRTFITLSLEKGMRPEIVMQIVGITNWDTFKKYIKLTDKIKVIEMKAKWNTP